MKYIVFVIGILALGGCQTTPQGMPPAQLNDNLSRIRLGMTKQQVVMLIGKPLKTNQIVDMSGTADEWLYMQSQFWTPGQAFAAGLAAGGNAPPPENRMVLHFKNDVLSSMQRQQ